jgi:hypothetical protein
MLYLFLTLLAAFLFYTREQWAVRPRTALQWYFLFTVVYFSYRWIFQLSQTSTTIFDSDAPLWARIIKDVVFVGFLIVCIVKQKLGYSPLIWYVLPFVAWFSVCNGVKLATVYDSYTAFFFWRVPLEYIPLAFVSFDEDLDYLLKFCIGCFWLVIGFLGVEVLSGRTTGFGHGGLYTRYGSVFGSPGDLGVFAVLALLAVLVFSGRIAKPMRVALILGLAITLFVTVSRSAWLALVAGLVVIWPVSKKWLAVLAAGAAVGCVLFLSALRDTQLTEDLLARATDASAMARIYQYEEARSEVYDWGLAGIMFGSWPHIDQEDFYLSVLLRSGFPGLFFFLVLAIATLVRARHPFLRAGFVSLLVASCFASFPDYWPSCAYFWLLVGATWKFSTMPRAAVLARDWSPLPDVTA